MTTKGRPYPWRVALVFEGTPGRIALDQVRTVDHDAIVPTLGKIDGPTAQAMLGTLAEMFSF